MVIGPDERRRFADDGYLLLPEVVPENLLAAVDEDVAAVEAFEPAPPGTVGPRFHFWDPRHLPAARAVPYDGGVQRLACELVAPLAIDLAVDHSQVAANVPPYEHRPGGPHIDGRRPDQDEPGSFTMLAAVFLAAEGHRQRGVETFVDVFAEDAPLER